MEGETIEAVCTAHPLAMPVLRRLGVALSDPAHALADRCRDSGLDVTSARAAIAVAEAELSGPWRGRPLTELLDHIVRTYHRPFARELSEVEALIATARSTQPGWDALAHDVSELRVDMEQHMEMEERMLFPWLRGRANSAAASIRAMQLEHADTVHLLLAIQVRAASCAAGEPQAVELATRLLQLERWLCEHLHFESNELFPRALQGEVAQG